MSEQTSSTNNLPGNSFQLSKTVDIHGPHPDVISSSISLPGFYVVTNAYVKKLMEFCAPKIIFI